MKKGFIDINKTFDFLNYIFDKDDIVCIALLKEQLEHRFIKLSEFEKYKNFFKKMNLYENKHIYYGLNSYKEFLKGKVSGRTKENVKLIKTIYLDIDDDINSRTILKQIYKDLKPSVVIETSNNKYQVIWKLKESLENSIENRLLVENLIKKMAKYYNADHTFDVSRIFRLPEFFNVKEKYFKNGKYPKSKIVDFVKYRVYLINDFKKIYDNIKIEEKQVKTHQIIDNSNLEDNSKKDFGKVIELLRKQKTDSEILDWLINDSFAKRKDQTRYAKLTLKNAKNQYKN